MKLKCVTYINSKNELERLIAAKHFNSTQVEILLAPKELARTSSIKSAELIDLLNLAKSSHLSVTLVWDALFVENKFQEACAFFKALPLHEFTAVRLQDPGAVYFVREHFPWLPIELILENSNHNLSALKKWQDYLGHQCRRLVLSNQLSKELIKEYAQKLSVPLEILVLGRVLLFYGPRKLLSPLHEGEALDELLASVSSEESPHTGFPVIENQHGTFMFNVKDLYLLDHLDELSEMGLQYARIDLRFDQLMDHLESLLGLFAGKISENDLLIKKNHVRPMIKGFYNINKTDVLFSKLKNARIARHDHLYVGEIVDVEKGEQIALKISASVFQCQEEVSLKLVTPDGKEKVLTIKSMKSTLSKDINVALKDDIVLLPYLNGVVVKTQVYLNART